MSKDSFKFFTSGPLADVETSIGLMTLFPVTVGNQDKIKETLGHAISDSSPSDYIKVLLHYILYPKEAIEEETRPGNNVDEALIAKLSDADYEKIAEAYIANNVYLYKELDFKKEKSESGEEQLKSDYSKTKYPRKEKETNVEYLHRLACGKCQDS
jgi:hypothetical protein